MLERQRMNGAVVASILIGMPVAEAHATVMEWGEEGLTRMQPSVNYMQRARNLAHIGETQAAIGSKGKSDTGWIEPKTRGASMVSVDALLTSPAELPTGMSADTGPGFDFALPGAFDAYLASYVPMGALPEEEIAPEEGEPDEGMPELDDVIIETGTGNLKPSLDELALAIPLEAITVLGASAAKRRDSDDALDDDANVFAHLNDDPLAQLAGEIAIHHDIPPALFVALIEAESSFDPDAISVKGAIGLTQLMPGTAEELGVDPEDPVENMTGGARYLAAQFKRFGAWDLALAAYNAGPTRVARLGAVPDYAETRGFVARVLKGAAQSPVRLANLN